jgi:hypothetical protein
MVIDEEDLVVLTVEEFERLDANHRQVGACTARPAGSPTRSPTSPASSTPWNPSSPPPGEDQSAEE